MTENSVRAHEGNIEVCPNPVFVVGAPRSGKTTLAGALAAHSEFWTSAETHILPALFGDARAEQLLERLLARPSPTWLRLQDVDPAEFLSYLGVGVNALFTHRSGGKRWVDHTAAHIFMADTLMAMFPGASLVHIVRDGRLAVQAMLDVERNLDPAQAKAMREGEFLPRWTRSLKEACRVWSQAVEAGIKATERYPERSLTVRFEDLRASPDARFPELLERLGASPEPGPSQYWRTKATRFGDEETSGSAQWKQWSPDEQRVFLDRARGAFVNSGLGSEADLTVGPESGAQVAKSGEAPSSSTSPSAAGDSSGRGPDFLGIGAQKSATTFVYQMLRRHPQVVFPATRERFKPPPIELDGREVVTWPKEIRFLNGENSRLSWDEYLSLFADKQPDKRYGEITPVYLLTPRSRIEELREQVPNVRLFAILRDPVERDWSSIRMVAARRGELEDPEALRRIAGFRQIRTRGDYVGCLRNWLSVFPREQLLIIPYEVLNGDPVAFLRPICEHLGVSVDPVVGKMQEAVYEGPTAPLPEDLRDYLTDRHRGIISKLRDVCGVDFSEHWSPALQRGKPGGPGEGTKSRRDESAIRVESLLVDPKKINFWYPNSSPGDASRDADGVLGGDWDTEAQHPFEDSPLFQACRERFEREGARQGPDSPNVVGELEVGINRDGRFVLFEDAERLAIARLSDLPEVPTRVVVRHEKWVSFKQEIMARARYADGTRIYQQIDHPDLSDIPATKSTDRFRVLRAALANYDCEGKKLIDIGAMWGYMAQQMEKLGFECTAIELKDDTFRMAERIRTATESRFTLWQGDFLEFPEPTADVVLALNIFHHPIKTQEGHDRLVDFLHRLSTDMLLFQTAHSTEEQMNSAYRNYDPPEFAEFVAEHAGLSSVQRIGAPDHGKRELFKLSR